jgi:hypothetical protein
MSKEIDLREEKIVDDLKKLNERFRNEGVSFDVDGVEVDSAPCAVAELNLRLGTNYQVRDLKKYWSVVDLLRNNHPQIKDPRGFAIELWNCDEVLGNPDSVSGAWLLANYFNREGIFPYRITSRLARTREATLNWYKVKMPWVDEKLIWMQEKDEEPGMDFKVETIKKLRPRFHFEDSFEHAQEIVRKTDTTVILIPQPWNINYIVNKPPEDKKILTPISYWQQSVKLVDIYIRLAVMLGSVAQS